MDFLTTKQASGFLEAHNIKLSDKDIANLCKNKIFPNAEKDSLGHWRIPKEDLERQIVVLRAKQTWRRVLTVSTITVVVAICGLISPIRDGVDLFFAYFVSPSSPSTFATDVPPIPSEIPTLTPPPTDTPSIPSITPTITMESPLLFVDNFDGLEISSEWDIISAGLSIMDGTLYANYTNGTKRFVGQYIERKVKDPQFKRVEFAAKVINGTSNGVLRLMTSCNDIDSRIHIDIYYTEHGVLGHYSSATIPEDFLNWGYIYNSSGEYKILLVQDGDVVQVFVNDVKMGEPFPCKEMGEWVWLVAAAGPDGHIEGYFDYIKLYAE